MFGLHQKQSHVEEHSGSGLKVADLSSPSKNCWEINYWSKSLRVVTINSLECSPMKPIDEKGPRRNLDHTNTPRIN
jgi:hypothetical protein